MHRDEIYLKLCKEVGGALKMDSAQIDPDSFLIGDLGAESIDLVDLTFRLEKAFELEIPERELFEGSDPPAENMRIRHVVDYLETALSRKK